MWVYHAAKSLKTSLATPPTRVLGTTYAVFLDPVFCRSLLPCIPMERSATHLGAGRSSLFARQRAQAQSRADDPANITWMGNETFLDAVRYLRHCA